VKPLRNALFSPFFAFWRLFQDAVAESIN